MGRMQRYGRRLFLILMVQVVSQEVGKMDQGCCELGVLKGPLRMRELQHRGTLLQVVLVQFLRFHTGFGSARPFRIPIRLGGHWKRRSHRFPFEI